MRNAMVFLALALLLGACAAPSTPAAGPASAQTPTPSTTPEATLSLTPTATVAEPTLSPTATASKTPEATPSLTPTFRFVLPSQTATMADALDCGLLTQSIVSGTEFSPGERFTAGWQIVNTGTATWYPGTVVFTFIGGTKMNLDSVVQLKRSVAPQNTVALSVDMKAPMNSTTYTSLWSLRQGTTYFCRVKVSIYVK